MVSPTKQSKTKHLKNEVEKEKYKFNGCECLLS